MKYRIGQLFSLSSLFILALFTIPLSADAQITVSQSQFYNMWTPGQLQYYSCPDTSTKSIDIGKTGGPNVYDFTGVTFEPVDTLHNYFVSTIPAIAARFPANAITFGSSPDSIERNPVVLFGNDTMFTLGKASVAPQYSFEHNVPYEPTIVFPATYGKKYWYTTAHFDTAYTSTGGIYSTNTYTGTDTVTVDGYGTLKIPGFEFQCLRVKLDHASFGDKEFFYMTREGVFVDIMLLSTFPDSGLVEQMEMTVLRAGTLLGVNTAAHAPEDFSLGQNYPNPFNPSTRIDYQLPANVHVTVKIYDVLGREVATLVNATQSAGVHSVTFDASRFSSGVYFYRLSAGGNVMTKKMALLK